MTFIKQEKWIGILRRAAVSLEFVLASALIAAVVMNVANIIARYVFGRSLSGADEWQIYLMVALAFFGSVVAAVRGQHLRMDVLNRFFPQAVQCVLGTVEAVASVVLCSFVCFVSTHYAVRMHQIGSVSENGHIPMWLPHSLVAVAFGAMTLVGVADLLLRLSGSRLVERESAATVVSEVVS